eukprot:TRINITY_DN2261_c3_g1_i1.p1 TRINITY_DN2261_c3_g1~~TRINITY_DN2261_c3_g1_i1.p1  ORF type:complete len:122 (+),score=14.10 TRINITY_DN2261_c3_g1_i1:37-402(+)
MPPPMPQKGLHHDLPPSGGSRMEMWFNSLPLLLGFVKMLPAFVGGFLCCFVLFMLVWGSQGIAKSIYPNITLNAVFIIVIIIASSYAQKGLNTHRETKDVKSRYREAQGKTEVHYRTPTLD